MDELLNRLREFDALRDADDARAPDGSASESTAVGATEGEEILPEAQPEFWENADAQWRDLLARLLSPARWSVHRKETVVTRMQPRKPPRFANNGYWSCLPAVFRQALAAQGV